MRGAFLVAGLLAVPLLAGCLDLPGSRDAAGEPLGGSDSPSGSDGGADDPSGDAPPAGGARGSPPGDAGADAMAGWPSIEAAKVRPGVQVVSDSGQCTSNFVFASPDNASLYLGAAAHCFEGMKIGDAVEIDGGTATGVLAYSSWLTMDEAKEEDATVREFNDFALVRIDDAYRDLVHPAVRHFGGPVALADSSSVVAGDKVLTYGNSGVRQQIDPASWHEGYVLDRANAWTTEVYTATPGVPGDSGSGVLTADGRALGVLVTLAILPTAGSNGVTSLDLALQYAKDHAGLEARLATWQLLDAGVLPGL